MNCAACKARNCYTGGKNCPGYDDETVQAIYSEEDMKMLRAAAAIEARYYLQACRLEESVKFAQDMGYEKLGVAFCLGLADEAAVIASYFRQYFAVESVCCKVCGFAKEKFALDKVQPDRYEAMCNPGGQADLLNKAGTQLNFAVGLCVGHDIVFARNSHAPVSTLVVKDRVLAHNPLGAVYSGYWRKNKLGIKD